MECKRQFVPTKFVCLMALAAIFLTRSCNTSPTTFLWNSPCSQGKPRETQQDDIQIENNDQRLRESMLEQKTKEMVISIRSTRNVTKKLLKYIMKKQLRNSQLKKECKKRAPLRGMPLIKSNKLFVKDWHQVLPDDFRRLSILSAFVYEASQEEFNLHRKKFNRLLAHLRRSMCLVSVVASSHEHPLTYDITPSIMLDVYKNLPDQSSRDVRNCMIVKDTEKVLKDMLRSYP